MLHSFTDVDATRVAWRVGESHPSRSADDAPTRGGMRRPGRTRAGRRSLAIEAATLRVRTSDSLQLSDSPEVESAPAEYEHRHAHAVLLRRRRSATSRGMAATLFRDRRGVADVRCGRLPRAEPSRPCGPSSADPSWTLPGPRAISLARTGDHSTLISAPLARTRSSHRVGGASGDEINQLAA
jgi:hypothetical protein